MAKRFKNEVEIVVLSESEEQTKRARANTFSGWPSNARMALNFNIIDKSKFHTLVRSYSCEFDVQSIDSIKLSNIMRMINIQRAITWNDAVLNEKRMKPLNVQCNEESIIMKDQLNTEIEAKGTSVITTSTKDQLDIEIKADERSSILMNDDSIDDMTLLIPSAVVLDIVTKDRLSMKMKAKKGSAITTPVKDQLYIEIEAGEKKRIISFMLRDEMTRFIDNEAKWMMSGTHYWNIGMYKRMNMKIEAKERPTEILTQDRLNKTFISTPYTKDQLNIEVKAKALTIDQLDIEIKDKEGSTITMPVEDQLDMKIETGERSRILTNSNFIEEEEIFEEAIDDIDFIDDNNSYFEDIFIDNIMCLIPKAENSNIATKNQKETKIEAKKRPTEILTQDQLINTKIKESTIDTSEYSYLYDTTSTIREHVQTLKDSLINQINIEFKKLITPLEDQQELEITRQNFIRHTLNQMANRNIQYLKKEIKRLEELIITVPTKDELDIKNEDKDKKIQILKEEIKIFEELLENQPDLKIEVNKGSTTATKDQLNLKIEAKEGLADITLERDIEMLEKVLESYESEIELKDRVKRELKIVINEEPITPIKDLDMEIEKEFTSQLTFPAEVASTSLKKRSKHSVKFMISNEIEKLTHNSENKEPEQRQPAKKPTKKDSELLKYWTNKLKENFRKIKFCCLRLLKKYWYTFFIRFMICLFVISTLSITFVLIQNRDHKHSSDFENVVTELNQQIYGQDDAISDVTGNGEDHKHSSDFENAVTELNQQIYDQDDAISVLIEDWEDHKYSSGFENTFTELNQQLYGQDDAISDLTGNRENHKHRSYFENVVTELNQQIYDQDDAISDLIEVWEDHKHSSDFKDAVNELINGQQIYGQDQGAIFYLSKYLLRDTPSSKIIVLVGGTDAGTSHTVKIIKKNFPRKYAIQEYVRLIGAPNPIFNILGYPFIHKDLIIMENLREGDLMDVVNCLKVYLKVHQNVYKNLMMTVLAVFNFNQVDDHSLRSTNVYQVLYEVEKAFNNEKVNAEIIPYISLDEYALMKCVVDEARKSNRLFTKHGINFILWNLYKDKHGCKGLIKGSNKQGSDKR